MTIPWRMRPGAGFVALVITLLFASGFFAWGARTPPLEEVWTALVDLEVGNDLSPRARALLRDTLVQHPDLAESLLEGAGSGLISANEDGLVQTRSAFGVRRSATPPVLLTVLPSKPFDHAVKVSVRIRGAEHVGTADAEHPFTWMLPDTGPFPQLVEIDLDRPEGKGVHWSFAVRLEEKR